jgi:hypothetical protein
MVIAQDQDKAEQAEVSRQSMADHKHEDRQRLLARRT